MKHQITFKNLVSEFRKNSSSPLMKLVLDEGFDYSVNRHPIENFLAREGIVYYFKGEGIEEKEDYEVNLNKLEIIYPDKGFLRS